ncbi:MAG TPA: hypothetical protein VLJ37_07960 [bacterium]|nr:hypothetical protein [bacterium]
MSALFDDMAVQSDRHGVDLRTSHAERFGHLVRWADSLEISAHTENAVGVGEHFFVVDKAMASRILTSALHSLSKARYFYKTILVTTKSPALRNVYEPRTLPDSGHVGRLNYFLEHC